MSAICRTRTSSFEEVIRVLLTEDWDARLNGKNIREICEMRSKMYFGQRFEQVYRMLTGAHALIMQADYQVPDGFEKIIKRYLDSDCLIDWQYRKFYTNYDKLENTADFEELRELVENIYTNEYLGKLLPKWNAGLQEKGALDVLPLQRKFFDTRAAYRAMSTMSPKLKNLAEEPAYIQRRVKSNSYEENFLQYFMPYLKQGYESIGSASRYDAQLKEESKRALKECIAKDSPLCYIWDI